MLTILNHLTVETDNNTCAEDNLGVGSMNKLYSSLEANKFGVIGELFVKYGTQSRGPKYSQHRFRKLT